MKNTMGFMSYICGLKDSPDKWISTCACFLEMSYDFLQFAEAYRLGDAAAIEYGYNKHLDVFQCNGQNKYVDICFAQNETDYLDSHYSMLQELRLNRCVRRYIDKRFFAQDEFLEHGNHFFSEFATPKKSVAAFENNSNYVGLGMKSRVFSDMWYSTTWKKDKEPSYRKNVAPCMTPEKRLCYQIFVQLNTHVVDANRVKFTNYQDLCWQREREVGCVLFGCCVLFCSCRSGDNAVIIVFTDVDASDDSLFAPPPERNVVSRSLTNIFQLVNTKKNPNMPSLRATLPRSCIAVMIQQSNPA